MSFNFIEKAKNVKGQLVLIQQQRLVNPFGFFSRRKNRVNLMTWTWIPLFLRGYKADRFHSTSQSKRTIKILRQRRRRIEARNDNKFERVARENHTIRAIPREPGNVRKKLTSLPRENILSFALTRRGVWFDPLKGWFLALPLLPSFQHASNHH